MNGSLLSLDLGTRIGWTIGQIDEKLPRFGTEELPGDVMIGVYAGLFDYFLHKKLNDMCLLPEPHHVVFEAPILPPKTHIMTTRKLQGLAWHTEFKCQERDVDCMEAHVSSVKKMWAGNGFAKKETMVAAAKRRGFDVSTSDEADALAVRFYTIMMQWPKVYVGIQETWPATVLVESARLKRSSGQPKFARRSAS